MKQYIDTPYLFFNILFHLLLIDQSHPIDCVHTVAEINVLFPTYLHFI